MAMSFRKTALVGGYCLAGLIGLALEAHAQADLVAQPPCTQIIPGAVTACVQFTGAAPPPSVLRSNSITVPSRGRVLASINGTGFCSNTSASKVGVDFSTQLVRDPTLQAAGHGNGGARHSFTLDPHINNVSTIQNFNLSSQRVFNVPAAGTVDVHFIIKIHKHDSVGVGSQPLCNLFNNTISLLFIPR